jgi:hypothetical protein
VANTPFSPAGRIVLRIVLPSTSENRTR